MNPDGPDSKAPGSAGYARPPAATRFRPGVSGNPKGRPKGSGRGLPYDAVLGQLVTIREDGRERRVTAAEAFLLKMTKSGLAGDGVAARAALAALANARAARGEGEDGSPTSQVIVLMGVSARNAVAGLRALNMIKVLDRFRPTAHVRIEPWLVQAALARLGERRLTLVEQAEVWRATRTPDKVQWPDWWQLTHEILATMPPPPPIEPPFYPDKTI